MAQRLAADGHDVEVITTFPHYPEWSFGDTRPPRTSESVEHGVRVRRLRHRLPRRGSSVSRAVSELSFGLRAMVHSFAVRALSARWGRPDAVVLVSPAMFASALLAPFLRLGRITFAVWVQDLYGLGVRETGAADGLGALASAISRLEGWLLRSADSVVVIHDGMAAEVAALGVANDRVSVVRNWTHIETTPLEDRSGLRAELGWHDDEVVVLHTGNMGAKQDLENVVDAAKLSDERGADVRFVLMGDGNARERVAAAGMGVERLQLVPPQDDVRYQQLLQAADILLVNEHPGLRGMALPSKLTSYFAARRPVLAATSAESATAAELRRAGTGVQVEPGDPAALLDAVSTLANDPSRMQALADSGYRYRRTELSVDGAAGRFARAIRLIVRKPTGDDLFPAPISRASAEVEAASGPLVLDTRPIEVIAMQEHTAVSADSLISAGIPDRADANDRG